jgi:hypothetical protein
MGETTNISKMAERISDELFRIFHWESIGIPNHNWQCVNQELHKRTTHPTDVVFYYNAPYSNEKILINFDLKSYKKTTIENKDKIVNAINNLSDSVECAKNSGDWLQVYNNEDEKTPTIYGSLFVFNYDKQYKKNLYAVLETYDKINIAKGVKIFIFSPLKILDLYSVSDDILKLTGKNQKLNNKDYSFYYPDLEKRKNVIPSEDICPATIESFFGPWLILDYFQPNKLEGENTRGITEGYIIYYFDKGNTVEEFVYLIDYLFKFQLLKDNIQIDIRGINSHERASNNWKTAKNTYGSRYRSKELIAARLGNTSFSAINLSIPQFSEIELG